MRAPLPIVLAAAALATAACGAERTAAPSLAAPEPVPRRPLAEFPAQGLAFELPEGWLTTQGPAPLVVTASSAEAVVAVWRYPRSEPLPRDAAQLATARESLLAAARARDPGFRASSSRAIRVAGLPAVEVRGRGEVEGQPRVLRSTHVFAFGAEVVVDAYAPRDQFAALERDVVQPLLRSLRLRQP